MNHLFSIICWSQFLKFVDFFISSSIVASQCYQFAVERKITFWHFNEHELSGHGVIQSCHL